MRKVIIVVAGIVLLGIAFLTSNYLKNSKKVPEQKVTKVEKTVFVKEVKNGDVAINISANGNLVAKNKVDIYSEVQGVLQTTGKDFRVGVSYKKGQTLLKINNQEFYASIQSQRSSLQNLIASIMPDIRLDYPDSFESWNTYLKNFDINKTVQPLPVPKSDKEKYFITGRNIYTTFYTIKNLEARLGKYNIRAPFNGVLTEALVTNGTLVRSGQKMGEFIDNSVFELALSVNGGLVDVLEVGKLVVLHNLEKTKVWKGKVSRINGKIDQASQTVQVFIEVKGNDLREGMYLEANVPVKSEKEAIEINRKLLVENKAVYVVRNNVLDLVEINPVHFNENTVVIKGLANGEELVDKPVAGAYAGMPVKIFSENKSTAKK
ncbi:MULTISPECIES: efflux RND transporter periplasmic adaptor subunit [unclassified Tenacibaculum]|uniref:efflux RND transporter periplasmic adaptor subunit n=1 Tax=unclassified Tenacibaculum TaxID=2635139 RepID=UPI001F48DF57|nr:MULTISPECIES: HlyD family efflux transporter periplasmic adaptor subunit [unclassified Tenacibaculum]MCF2876355.1 efflux RND transporter periplasmic adaptor subunit [Tenacibaculum sp. Cn5-1]MCF2936502.1 efflux RND transporter periplasmic adaptor subunit [Tenacibaculum sp. Cn5-34]MCG7512773.1 efflux RND transporter periplasmic adaptor subunit [Tenacibaculum sp. Cn5-46]